MENRDNCSFKIEIQDKKEEEHKVQLSSLIYLFIVLKRLDSFKLSKFYVRYACSSIF